MRTATHQNHFTGAAWCSMWSDGVFRCMRDNQLHWHFYRNVKHVSRLVHGTAKLLADTSAMILTHFKKPWLLLLSQHTSQPQAQITCGDVRHSDRLYASNDEAVALRLPLRLNTLSSYQKHCDDTNVLTLLDKQNKYQGRHEHRNKPRFAPTASRGLHTSTAKWLILEAEPHLQWLFPMIAFNNG